jgi:hypothetical protein
MADGYSVGHPLPKGMLMPRHRFSIGDRVAVVADDELEMNIGYQGVVVGVNEFDIGANVSNDYILYSVDFGDNPSMYGLWTCNILPRDTGRRYYGDQIESISPRIKTWPNPKSKRYSNMKTVVALGG